MQVLLNIKNTLFLILIFTICSVQSHILEGLKDAVLNAEGIVGDVLRSLNSVSKHLKFTKEAWKDAVEEECKFLCPDGGTPRKNKYHKPSSNGCGAVGMEIDTQYLPSSEMTRCCDQHDICYGTCNNDKDECDLAFRKCLYKQCDNTKSKMNEIAKTGCKTASKMLYSGTMLLGCTFYKQAQQEACYCPPSRKFTGDEF